MSGAPPFCHVPCGRTDYPYMADWQPDDSPFARHFWPFYAMAVAPDGSWLVTGGGDGTLRTWHATGEAFGTPIYAESDWA